MTSKTPHGNHVAWAALAVAISFGSRSAKAEERAYEQAQQAPVDAAAPRGEPTRDARGRSTRDVLPEIEPRRGGSNYFVANLYDGRTGADPKEQGLVKFRIDLEYDIARLENWENAGFFYLTFPIRLLSFWDLFDALPESQSSPFIETNYAPGLEASWVAPERLAGFFGVRAGVLHESNGVGFINAGSDQVSSSRSWNRVYLGSSYELPWRGAFRAKLDAMVWLPFGSERVAAWPNEKDAGTRLEDHLGHAELTADLLLGWPTLRLRARRASLDAELRVPFKSAQLFDGASRNGNGFRLDIIAQCQIGNGERLIIANENRYSCYAGVGL